MALSDVKDKMESAGIHIIPVEGSADRDNAKGLIFAGKIQDYIEALKVLKSDVVFFGSS